RLILLGKREPATLDDPYSRKPLRWGGGSRRTVSRVLYPSRDGDHLSTTPVARRLQRPKPEDSASSLTVLLFGLAPGGVCLAGRSPGRRWALTPPFHPYRRPSSGDDARRRCNFCGTFLRVTPTGCYPAPCSLEPGLSSNRLLGRRSPVRLGPPESYPRMLASILRVRDARNRPLVTWKTPWMR